MVSAYEVADNGLVSVMDIKPILPNQPQLNMVHQILAATAGSIMTSFFVTPFDVVKTRLQAESLKNAMHRGGSMEVLQGVLRAEGAVGLWRGLSPMLIMSLPNNGVYYGLYDAAKKELTAAGVDPQLAPLLSGSIARVCASLITAPLELVRTKMQADAKSNLGIVNTLGAAFRRAGLASLFTGLGPTLLRDVPFSAVYWTVYEETRRRSRSRPGALGLGLGSDLWNSFLCGAAAGTAAAFLTNPADVVKTRIQAELNTAAHSSIRGVVAAIYRDRGLIGFGCGLVPRTMRVAPACAIMISSYEGAKRMLLG